MRTSALLCFLCIPCASLALSKTPSEPRSLLFKRKKKDPVGKSSTGASIFNLVNNVAGAGLLALAAGASSTGSVPAVGLCALLGAVSAQTFHLIGKACQLTSTSNFKDLWAATLGRNTTYLVDTLIALLCFSCAVIYAGILGDLVTQLGGTRWTNILALTAVLLPMSLIKDLSVLAFTSVLGFGAILYTVVFIVWRFLDQSYALPAGKFVSGLNPVALLPSFTKASTWRLDFSSLVLASNLGLAYIAHYNGPTFYRNMKHPEQFRSMVYTSFAVLIVLYAVTMLAGAWTFGDVCQGNILLNYHANDVLGMLGRVATFVSILFGFPLVLTGAREGVAGTLSSFGTSVPHVPLVSLLLAGVMVIACAVPDVSLVVGLTGASMGSFIVYICPAFLYTRAASMYGEKGARGYALLVPFGILIGVLGVYMTLTQ